MFRNTVLTLAVCAVAVYLAPGEAQAQRGHGGRGGHGGFSRGGSFGHAGVVRGYYGGYGGYGRYGHYGYGRYGYGRYGYRGFGLYGLGLYGLGYGLGYGYGYAPGYYAVSPYDYGSGYAPDYDYGLDAYGYAPDAADAYPAPGYSGGPTTSGYYSPPAGESGREPGSVQIEVRVPPGAEVWFDGVKSSQTGPDRLYSTPALTPGKSYQYEVTARWREGGRDVERKQTVRFKGGEAGPVVVDFTRPDREAGSRTPSE
jgi:uncharacterized protein (TIGR03000 family)